MINYQRYGRLQTQTKSADKPQTRLYVAQMNRHIFPHFKKIYSTFGGIFASSDCSFSICSCRSRYLFSSFSLLSQQISRRSVPALRSTKIKSNKIKSEDISISGSLLFPRISFQLQAAFNSEQIRFEIEHFLLRWQN
jgi:hypothetical protein